MRYVLLTSCMFLLSCVTLFSQRIFYKYSKYTLEVDYDKCLFSIYIQYPDEPKVHFQHSEITSFEYFSEGILKKEQDFIVCEDTMENKHIFKFKKLSQFSLKIESSSAGYLLPQDSLYAIECQFKDFIISRMKFKNGLPNGTWTVWQPPIHYSILYEDGKILKIENITNVRTDTGFTLSSP